MMAAVPLALAMDAIVGDPPDLWRRVGHPVTWMGAAIDSSDRHLNKGSSPRLRGALALGVLIALVGTIAGILSNVLSGFATGFILEALLASVFLAHRSLHQHVAAVARASSLNAARKAVAMIVGRDVSRLDDEGVVRASVETLSESLSDGVVAPAFWFALFGLPGIAIYKLVNTADSMVGHRTPRHAEFGWASARLDDVLNIMPARLTALATIAISPSARRRWSEIVTDAQAHVSPNAGWPEAAFAHALDIELGGPRNYGDRSVNGAFLNRGGSAATVVDLRRALRLSTFVGLLQFAVYAVLAIALF
ncbi:MAG: adenosylcobinamide-phosphate synthase CbiB [Pseudomonadota bacterium]